MKEENNTFTVAASSLDYSNLAVCNNAYVIGNDSYVISNHEIPLEKVSGVIDKFEEETKARKKDIEDLKLFTELSKEAILESFDYNINSIKKEIQTLKIYVDANYDAAVNRSTTTCRRELDEKLNVIKNQLYICMSIFGSLTLFLLFGFIYCMMFK